MVQLIKESGIWTLYGLSTDDKDEAFEAVGAPFFRPVLFKELDTGKTYYYDVESEDFVEWGTAPTAGGGGATSK